MGHFGVIMLEVLFCLVKTPPITYILYDNTRTSTSIWYRSSVNLFLDHSMRYCHWQDRITDLHLHVLHFLSLHEKTACKKYQALIWIPIGYFTNVGWDNNEAFNSYGLCCTPKLISWPSVIFPCWVWIHSRALQRIGWLCKSQWTTGSLPVPDLDLFCSCLSYWTPVQHLHCCGGIAKTSFATFESCGNLKFPDRSLSFDKFSQITSILKKFRPLVSVAIASLTTATNSPWRSSKLRFSKKVWYPAMKNCAEETFPWSLAS